jgi:hypothetical protein
VFEGDWISEIHSRRHSSCACRLQGHGDRHSDVAGESTPSSCRQIQQCRGSGCSGCSWGVVAGEELLDEIG